MRCDKVFTEIDNLYSEYLAFFEDVCNIESPTGNKAGVDAVGAYFIAWAKRLGFAVEVHEESVSGNAVAITMNADAKGTPIALSGHMDTVYPIGMFGTPAVHCDEEKLYGPGAADCKGGVVAGALAMAALAACGYTDRPVLLLLQSDEENGSTFSNKATIRFICEKAKNAAAFLNLEGHAGKDEACVARKGILNYTFRVKGVEAHASKCATEGANAIREAAHKIIELEKLKDDDGLTCSCGVISGGTVPNTVAGACEFKVNIRFATEEQRAWVQEYVQKIADTVYVEGCTTELALFSHRVAMERVPQNLALLDRLNEIFAAHGMQTVRGVMRKGGSDAADVTAAGIPCVDNVGIQGGSIHSIHEFAYLASLPDTAKRLAAAILEL